MKSKMILACAGLAICGTSQAQVARDVSELEFVPHSELQELRPIYIEEVLGFNENGMPITGPKIYLNDGVSTSRGTAALTPYWDAFGMNDTDSDGVPGANIADILDCSASVGVCDDVPPLGSFIESDATFTILDSFSYDPARAGENWEGNSMLLQIRGCVEPDPITGDPGSSEPLQILHFIWDSADTSLNGDITDGFEDPDFPGSASFRLPYDESTFVGGYISTFAGDIPQGFYVLDMTELSTFGIIIPLPGTNHDGSTDGSADATMDITFSSGTSDTNGDTVADIRFISEETSIALGANGRDDLSGCMRDLGYSSPGVWGRGFNQCGDPLVDPGWSEVTASTTDLNVFEPSDIRFFDNTGSCPDNFPTFSVTSWVAGSAAPSRLCGDVNDDGAVTDSDFFAWVTAFIADPRTPAEEVACDVNNDGSCNDSDFFAWVTEFINATSTPPGPLTNCPAIP